MSYIAVELDVLGAAPNAARAAGVSEDTIIGGLNRLWAYAFRAKRDLLHDLEVRGCFATTVDVLPALKAFGWLAEAPDGQLRVRGADRYLRISEARSKGGKAASGNLRRGAKREEAQPELTPGSLPAEAGGQPGTSPGCFPALSPSTEHRAPNTLTDDDQPPVDRSSGPLIFVEPTTPSHTWSPRDFFAWAQTVRQRAGWVAERWPRKDLGRWWSEVQMTPGMEAHREGVDRLRAGFLAFAQDPHWRKAKPPAPFQAFMAQWRDHVPAEIPSARVAS